MVFGADALGAWLVEQLADAGRKKLTELVLGSEQERALRQAADAAVWATARDMRPSGGEQTEHLAMVISQVFGDPVLDDAGADGPATLREGLQAGIARQLAVLDDAELTGTGQSSADVLGVAGADLAASLTGHLLREIMIRGARGGPLTALAAQLNDDLTHLQVQRIEDQGQRVESKVDQVLDTLRAGDGAALPGGVRKEAGWPLTDVRNPFDLEVHRPVEPDTPLPRLPILPEYWPRDHDTALTEVVTAAAAGTSGIAVLVGGSSTGKTRACWQALELLRNVEPGWRLWHPIDPSHQQAVLAGLPGVRPRTVVWLNEAQKYLRSSDGTGEQVASALRDLVRSPGRGPVLVLATLWPIYWSELTASPDTSAGQLLAGHDIPVAPRFTKEQLRGLEKAADPRLVQAGAASRDGEVIQYLAGAPDLLNRYRNARPEDRALIDAAMDARRLGMGHALPRAFLEAAAHGYLTDADLDQLDHDWLEQALHRTEKYRKGVRGPLAPIRTRPAPGALAGTGDRELWQLADYLDQQGRRIRREEIPPETFWAAAVSHAAAPDLIALAQAAEDRGLYRNAARLYKQASARGDPQAGASLVRWLHDLHPGDQGPADWAAAHVSLDDPHAVTGLLHQLLAVGADGQVSALLDRDPATHVSLDDPGAVAGLLWVLREDGTPSQVTALLDRDPAAHASLDAPFDVASLLDELAEVEAAGQVTALASRAAAHASLDNPGAVARLLDALHDASADEQVTALSGRAAAHAPLDDPGSVAHLLDAVLAAGTRAQATTLVERLPAAGQFKVFELFWRYEGRAEQFRFGREADGRPAEAWGWTDLG